jgi:hypothetical protein
MAEPVPDSSDLTQPITISPDQDPVIKEEPPSPPKRDAALSEFDFPLSPQSLLHADPVSQGEVPVHDGPMWNRDAITDGQLYHLMNIHRPNSERGILQKDALDTANEFALEEDLLRHFNEYNQNAKDQDDTQKPKKQRRNPAKTAEEAHKRKHDDEAEKKKRKLSSPGSMGLGETGKRSRMGKKRADDRTGNTSLFNNLTNQDVFAAYEAAPGHNEAPEITATTKKKQLDQLLENSAQYDMHKCRTNKRTLSEATKRFGFKQMSVDKGR